MFLFKYLSGQTLKNIEWADPSKNTMIYKFPMDGRKIMFGSKLTVRESQVAIFLNKGKLADIFVPGIHTLHTSNLPILSNLLHWARGFKSPFFADVFFVNTKQFTNQKWGTGNPIAMRDKEFGTIRVRGYGTFAFKVDNAEVFLKELFGTNSTFETEDISQYLRSMLVSSISDTIAESKISALDLASNLMEFTKLAKTNVSASFETLGLKLTNLVIENLSFPEEVEKALDKRASLGVLKDEMDTYMKMETANAMRDAAKNPGAGGVGAQIGTGIALGEIIKQNMSKSGESTSKDNAKKKYCQECGAENKLSAKFCAECGFKLSTVQTCPECGTELNAKAKFCPECGAKVK